MTRHSQHAPTMKATASAQFQAWENKQIPVVDEVRPGVWSLPLPMHDGMSLYSFCYAIAGTDGSLHLVDPGVASDEAWEALTRSLHETGRDVTDVVSIFSTHFHPDHTGLVNRIRETSGAVLVMTQREQDTVASLDGRFPDPEVLLDRWQVPESRRPELRAVAAAGQEYPLTHADGGLQDGARWDVPGRQLDVVLTPGHTPGHGCLIDRAHNLLFSGDHVLPNQFPGLGLGGSPESNPVDEYCASLERIKEFGTAEVAPGHGYRFTGLVARCNESRDHQVRRVREARRVRDDQPEASIFEVASRLSWTAGWSQLSGVFLFSALTQTTHYVESRLPGL